MSLLSIYKNKKVFITGHTGFKGSWMTLILKKLGADVRGYSLAPNTSPNHFNLLGLENEIDHIEGDIKDFDLLNKSLHDFKPEFVFHLAAQPLVRESYENPVYTLNTNIMGSINLLEAVRNAEFVRSLTYITSDKCYENVEWIWGYRENDKMGGHDPYSASKGAAELVFSSYLRSFFSNNPDLGAGSARAGNVIGGGDWSANRIIPDCIRAIESEKPIILRNPKSTRPWQHVLEPISGYLLLGANLKNNPDKFSGSWNFGPNTSEHRNVEQVASSIIEYMQKGSIEISKDSNDQHEANLLQLNCDKASQLLEWSPRWGVSKTIEETAKWYNHYLEGTDMKRVSLDQIVEYFNGEIS
ncbi:MAG: CDP-glucose 4,6-dehydratase [Flavobacteriaceae bacterium TMED238]|nr:MAG: CDP-glucose 4,6-dehydratase [Flavobacteriaceae bacterium TMED238]|tara:strand:+ start:9402 stop:10469 length:1068 start_codon:yes stop_codon:yes gene_type:complete